jgi:hypothetical protein
MIESETPSFPIYVTLPVAAAMLSLVLVQVWRLGDACASFLFLATWFRYSIATFHQYTHPPVVLGLSLMALTSIAVIAIGLVVVGGRSLLLRRLTPIYAIILVSLISAAANQVWIGAINATFKLLYLIVFALAAYHAVQQLGTERVFRSFALIFVGPIALQWLSVLWGLKTGREGGQSFFIGGYQHQQSLSIILITFLYVTCFAPPLSVIATFGRVAVVAIGLALANYRTAILAAALPIAALTISKVIGKFVSHQRLLIVGLLAIVTAFVFAGIASLAQERFADIGTVLDKGASLIKPPDHFTPEDKRLFSGRVHLWSQYIDAYLGGDIINALVGFGPEAWIGRFSNYAHNTFVSYLYELGLFGLAAFVWILIANLLVATRVGDDNRWMLVTCHIGFIVLNCSTMAIWTLEGSILYALLLSQTWYLQSIRREGRGVPHSCGRARLNAYSSSSR